jgi:hypothetical protein
MPADDSVATRADAGSALRERLSTTLSRKRTLKALLPPHKFRLTEQPEQEIVRSLVVVRFDTPFPIDALSTNSAIGVGVVVNAGLGLVVVSKATVPQSFGNVKITFHGLVDVAATVKVIHPQLNFAIIEYDPSDPSLSGLEIASACLRAKGGAAVVGMPVRLVALEGDSQVHIAQGHVSRIEHPTSHSTTKAALRNMCMNTNLISVAGIPQLSAGGVLMNEQLEVFALWAAFPAGVHEVVKLERAPEN